MGDDIDLTPAERELLDSIQMKARVRQQRRDAEAAADAERRRTDAAVHAEREHRRMMRWAEERGMDWDAIKEAAARTGCDVCDGLQDLDDIPIAFVPSLCGEHGPAVERRVCETVLRAIIPPGLHKAQPAELRPELRAWSPDTGGVYLYGPVGTGKSHDAAALVKVAWSFMRKADNTRIPNVLWRGVPAMMDDIAATFGKDREYPMDAVRSADILVLDDIGMADDMAFAVRKMYALLEHRLQHGLVTLVTSNRNLDGLARHLDSPQIASRLAQMCAQVSYEGFPDRRPDLAPRLDAPGEQPNPTEEPNE